MGYRMLHAAQKGPSSAGPNFFAEFKGALPTSIQNGYCEVYGKSPDIDSTALMVSVTCKCCLGNERLALKLIPRLRDALTYLEGRDLDGDMLLEQGPNEDWMDRMLRTGKLVYNQGLWIAALTQWSTLLRTVGKNEEADLADGKADSVIEAVESKMWRSDWDCYADESTTGNPGDAKITQDICFFLHSIKNKKHSQERINKTLATIEKTLWKAHGAACQEPPSKNTVPPILGPYKYQNGGVWSWITATEVLTRLSYGQIKESRLLLERVLPVAHLEWVDPNNTRSGGAFPFRTGIAATRTALRNFLALSRKE
jgi:glycogen debranching enzyme